jgi:HlyD family secretion protein
MKKTSPKILAILLFASSLVFLTNCSSGETGIIKAQGIVEGDVISIKVQASGFITDLFLPEGTSVKKGDFLAQVDDRKVKNKIEALTISLKEIEINRLQHKKKSVLLDEQINYFKKQVKRFKRLTEKRSIAGDDLDKMELKLLEAKTARFNLQKSLENLQIQQEKVENQLAYLDLILKDHRLLSPIDGVILEKFVSAGQLLSPGIPLADIMDQDSMFIDVFIEEQEIAALRPNQEVELLLDGDSGSEKGVIAGFGRKAEFSPKYIISEKERKSLLYKVKIKITDNKEKFKLGMPVTVKMKKEK